VRERLGDKDRFDEIVKILVDFDGYMALTQEGEESLCLFIKLYENSNNQISSSVDCLKDLPGFLLYFPNVLLYKYNNQ